ncbi:MULTISPECIES: TlyA family RNA methyltransferase [unclassified Lactobacillus]|uniref:TlyA family RNA methyltransferase n=1 Tax=unclassified Lactobacillus TaxID=2620435 RepID=UPI000EFA8C31|nr:MULTISPECIES: TlyA family RNA methyltransferase [unclassified Lactobacillus]RMC24549.1 TlyA family RNA methyltransferase [Lactobacillus sp. ESL0247]RMC28688.1 TlyA family RNA methyltransferase [Lactobacillus sp. ESL0246]RMC31880.1 TlyA family RNA methyltransferase [Lactobacillus sp. ESL0245]RMC49017.1 TlyA family RNA methyltransferase [Lactobacillus sp. ESL0228]
MDKERADVLLTKQGLFNSRTQAQRAIMAGLVCDHNHQRIDKSGTSFPINEQFFIKDLGKKYVSRGGFKLEKALESFEINLSDKICLDIGASTGGFTDVALQNKAKLVYALDVGYNQLAWQLRDDPRVVVMEKQNFRYSMPKDFTKGLPDFAMTDVSFISLDLIMPPMYEILKDHCDAVCLIKPQFEAGPEKVGKHGIVTDHQVHCAVIEHTIKQALEIGFNVLDVDYSPIKGGKGNIEFLIHLQKDLATGGRLLWSQTPAEIVEKAVAGL